MHQPTLGRPFRRLCLSAALLLLHACGGGGGGAVADPEPPPAVPGAGLPAVDVSAVPAADAGSTLPADWHRRAFMQVFVRSYQDSDGDGYGDLRGLTQRLDYLKALGVGGLWLMPVARSQDRDHGYAVSDYRAIERDYGSLAEFDELLRQAHARGIGVIVDYVMNHSAAEHPLFANARSGAANPYRDWYLFQAVKPGGWSIFGADPWRGSIGNVYFAPFWDQMPDFNLLNPRVVAWHHDNLRWWLNRGVDGFRFDAVGNLVENGPGAWENQPQNHVLLSDARRLLAGYAQRHMVCEGPSAPSAYMQSCGSAFAFAQAADAIGAARGDAAAVQRVARYVQQAPAGAATMLSNHDSFAGQRVWDQLGGDLAAYRLAAATLLLQPGTPFIYYGEEIGLAGAATLSGDPRLRTPMSWTGNPADAGFTSGRPYRALSANVATHNVAAQSADPDSLLAFYKALLALRNTQVALRSGTADAVAVSGSVLSFQRRQGGATVVVAINYGGAPASVALDSLPAGARLASAYPADGTALSADAAGRATLALGARALRVLTLE